MTQMTSISPSANKRTQARAWAVHLYTMSGGVVGMFALYQAAEGNIREAFILLVIAMLIDATDGLMARRFDVRGNLPAFDGAMVDNVIDMLTFVWIPVFIMWQAELLPHVAWTIVPMLAGLYAYGQSDMKTEDNFFLGFPSYWNVVALYLWWLQPIDEIAILIVVIPAILTFIPTRYLYPSKNFIYWRMTWALGILWFILVFVLLAQPEANPTLALISAYYPLYYMLLSFYVDYRVRVGKPLSNKNN